MNQKLSVAVKKIRTHQMARVLLGGAFCMGTLTTSVAEKVSSPSKEDGAVSPVNTSKKQKAVIGLGGAPVSRTLQMQLSLPLGQGVTIFHVVKGSPAEKAGFKRHDILMTFNGMPVGSQREICNAIAKCSPNEEVVLGYLRAGKLYRQKVILGSESDAFARRDAQEKNVRRMFLGLGSEISEADKKLMQMSIQRHMYNLQKELLKMKMIELNFNKAFQKKNGKGGVAQGLRLNSASSITMSDDKGTVTMKSLNGKAYVILQDKEGKVLFKGPYGTDKEKQRVSEKFRKRIEDCGFNWNGKSSFLFKIQPCPLTEHPSMER